MPQPLSQPCFFTRSLLWQRELRRARQKGWSNVVGADLKFDLSDIVDIGASGTARIGTSGRNISWSGGPTLTVTPFDNANITVGYNIVGFEDRDFEESRYTRSGPFLTFKLKFDQQSLAELRF